MMIAALLALAFSAPSQAPEVRLWRLDCGTIRMTDYSGFSDTNRYDGRGHTLAVGCYLIRHGDQYLLWDAGLSGDFEGRSVEAGGGYTLSVRERIVPQLARIGVRPEQIRFVGISHRHSDHTGQARDFPGATLLIGSPDWEVLRGTELAREREGVTPWLEGGATVEPVTGDHDVFGDGSVVMLAMPGHTPGHHALLVKLAGMGPVLLSGDQFHSRESYEANQVPQFNADRADTLASSDRFRGIAATLNATVIVQHEAGDVARLPDRKREREPGDFRRGHIG